MNKDLYRTTVNRKKEILFYVATFGGRKDVSLVIATKEPIYWRVREELQAHADSGDLQPVFEGGVHIRRVHRIHEDTANISAAILPIKRKFNAISYEDLEEIQQTKETNNLERFFTTISQEEIGLKQIMPFKKMKFEEYFLKAMRNEFPELVKNVTKEYNQRAEHYEIM